MAGNKYVQLLDPNYGAGLNNGTHAGGLGFLASQIMQGLNVGRQRQQAEQEKQQEALAQERFIQGFTGQGAPNRTYADPTGAPLTPGGTGQAPQGYKGAMDALQGITGPRATELMMTAMQGQQTEQQRAEEQRRAQEQQQAVWARQDAQRAEDNARQQQQWEASFGLQQQKANQPPSQPAEVREYEFAKSNGFQGSYLDFIAAKSGPQSAGSPWDDYKVVNGQVLAIDPNTGKPMPVYSPPPEPEPVSGPDVEGEGKLRREFNGVIDSYIDVRDSFGRIIASAQDPSGAGDLALIFNYMKVLDPASTVRDSEFATAENAGGVPAKILNTYNKVFSGERLAPEQRADFVDRATRLYRQQEAYFKGAVDQYSKLAEAYGFDPTRIVGTWSNNIPSMPNQGALVGADGAPQPAVPVQTPAPQPAPMPTPAPQPAASGQFQMVEDQDFGSIPVITTQEQWDALPPGTHFNDGQGNVRQKPAANAAQGMPDGASVR